MVVIVRLKLYWDKLKDDLVGSVLDTCTGAYVGQETVSGFPFPEPSDGFGGVELE